MIWRTTDVQEAFLLTQPESGMGYQLIEFVDTLEDRLRTAVVFQARLVVELDEAFDMELSYLAQRNDLDGWVLEPGSFGLLREVKELKLIKPPSTALLHMVAEPSLGKCGRRNGGYGALDAPTFEVDGIAHYVRISAFANDRRVDQLNGCLVPGTFATSVQDYWACVRCPDDPIDRYALPNTLPSTTAFHIRPVKPDLLQKGVVQPIFYHAGGGEEFYFSQGTSRGTVLDVRPYGHEAHH